MGRTRNNFDNRNISIFPTKEALPPAEQFGIGTAQVGNVLYSSDGGSWQIIPGSAKSIILLGGDHPQSQYLNGLHKVALDRGLPWYVAINTDGNLMSPGVNGNLSWPEIKKIQAEGVEIVSHGTEPHINDWNRVSTGIRIKYTGNGTAATVTIAGTFPAITITGTVTGQSDSSVGWSSVNLNTTYKTISELVTYINSIAGWSCYADPSLPSDAPSNALINQTLSLVISSTGTPTFSGGKCTATFTNHGLWAGDTADRSGGQTGATFITDIVDSNTVKYSATGAPSGVVNLSNIYRPMSCGAGIILENRPDTSGTSGTTGHKNVWCLYGRTGTTFNILADGINIYSVNLASATYDTLVELVADINTQLNTKGITARLSDDRRSSGNTNSFPWCHGGEASVRLFHCSAKQVLDQTALFAGMSQHQVVYNKLKKCYDTALANGITLKSFASAGSNFTENLLPAVRQLHKEIRFNPTRSTDIGNGNPELICALHPNSHGVYEPNTTTGVTESSHLIALADALADSQGFLLNFLCHGVSVDGSSGYSLGTSNTTVDLPESQLVAFLDRVAYHANNGDITPATFVTVGHLKEVAVKPRNLLFNPRFKNAGHNHMTMIAAGDMKGGSTNLKEVPGMLVQLQNSSTGVTGVTASSIDSDGRWTITTNSGVEANPIRITWPKVPIEIGKQYLLSISVEVLDFTAPIDTSLGRCYFRIQSEKQGFQDVWQASNWYWRQSEQIFDVSGEICMPLSIKIPDVPKPELISKTGPFTLTAAHSVNISVGQAANVITNLDLSGGTGGSHTANAIAARINTAMDAAIAAGTVDASYKNFATVRHGRIVLTDAYEIDDTGTMLSVRDNTGTTQTTAVWNSGFPTAERFFGAAHYPATQPLVVQFVSTITGTIRISNPVLCEI